MATLSNKPVRKGATYCAPFCGRGCTWAEHQAAKKKAAALQKIMGHGWKPVVWENLGWHYKVVSNNEKLKIHPSVHLGEIVAYTAFLGEGDCGGTWTARHKNPKQAATDVIQAAKAEVIETLTTILEIIPC